MSAETQSLLRVMRCELTATNNQFMHILALGRWGEKDAARRITQVDDVDFANAMRIANHLVENKAPILLEPCEFVPGANLETILVSELAMERQIKAALDAADCVEPRALELIETARAPRDAYGTWLAEQLVGVDRKQPVRACDAASNTVAHLITLMEQSLIHAFVHRNTGDAAGADAAWATSGAAMMHLTEFVHLYARRATLPTPGKCPAPRIAQDGEAAHALDLELALLCAREAARAADICEDSSTAGLCRRVAVYSNELADWRPGQIHPAAESNPAVFSSFETTLSKIL